MRIELTNGQASWILMVASEACLAHLLRETSPNEMQLIAYEQVHKPLMKALQKKVRHWYD